MRWLAPEIIKPSTGTGNALESKPADVFAFAMLAIEVFTVKVPFEGLGGPGTASRIFKGDRPEFPGNAEDVGLTIPMREFLQKCWDQDPTKRPTIEDVVTTWEGLLGNDMCVQRTSRNRNRGESAPNADDSPSEPGPSHPSTETEEQPDRPSKCFLCSLDINNSSTWRVTMFRFWRDRKNLQEGVAWVEVNSGLDPAPFIPLLLGRIASRLSPAAF